MEEFRRSVAESIRQGAAEPHAHPRARTRVRRTDFDLGLYAPMTSDTVDIIIETEMREKK